MHAAEVYVRIGALIIFSKNCTKYLVVSGFELRPPVRQASALSNALCPAGYESDITKFCNQGKGTAPIRVRVLVAAGNEAKEEEGIELQKCH